jgi:molybdopterin molybdotransferase
MLSVAEALERILANARPSMSGMVTLREAAGRTLCAPVIAQRTQPPQAVSAMDGYAIKSANAQEGAELTVIGTVPAGRPFNGVVSDGEAVRIFTGAVVPDGADTVIIQENVTSLAERGSPARIRLDAVATAHANIRAAGLDFRSGDQLLNSGTLITPSNIALAASGNHAALPVYNRPKVAVIATGDELREPGSTLDAGQIIASNSFAIMALAEKHGAEIMDLGIVADDAKLIGAALDRAFACDADVIVTLGGASVGDHDLVQACFKAAGVTLGFWKIAMRPGKPLMFGTVERRSGASPQLGPIHVIGLPGNPVSSFVCAELFLVPLIAALQGREHQPEVRKAVLADPLPPNGPREHYARARITRESDTGMPVVSLFSDQDSSLLIPLAEADGLVIQPAGDPGAPKGAIVRFRTF